MRQHRSNCREYLLMAALLIEIKSRMLLRDRSGEPEEEDPRAELCAAAGIRRIKLAAQHSMSCPSRTGFYSGAGLARPRSRGKGLPEVHSEDLRNAGWTDRAGAGDAPPQDSRRAACRSAST